MPMPIFVAVPIWNLCPLSHESSVPATQRAWHSAWTSHGHNSVNLTLNRNIGPGEGGQIGNYSNGHTVVREIFGVKKFSLMSLTDKN